LIDASRSALRGFSHVIRNNSVASR